jgi:Protein of unknown function (DUF1592)/Protein of unknown function (DUF1588)/Protein of unknown function (DUF1585)/Protein of unknown function (DUF1587)/Protein of unknown function (DUF1595)
MSFSRDPVKRNARQFALRLLPVAVLVSGAAVGQGVGQEQIDWDLIDEYCTECHNLDDFAGSTAFDLLARDSLATDVDTWELAIRKVRTGMMPPAGNPRPSREALDGLTHALGVALDAEYAHSPNPGSIGLARLNREEYRNSIRDLLQFDASSIVANIPAESAGEGFNNNIALLSVSPTLIDAYAGAAMRISREAVGDLSLIPSELEFTAANGIADALPLGTRNGLAITYNFPLDAKYEFTVGGRSGGIFGGPGFCIGGNQVVVSIDGELVELEDPNKFQLPVNAGPHTIAAALQDVKRCTGVNDYFDDYNLDGSIASIKINGPFEISGAGNTPSRRAIFSCYPQAVTEERNCAQEILTRLATRGWRKPVAANSDEVAELLSFYDKGQQLDGFEMGMQYALARLLMDPRFLYQVEDQPADAKPGSIYSINDVELASRLSFFLWSSIPDEELLTLASKNRLHEPAVLDAQVERMLRDGKAEALVKNFAGQWLRLRELDAAQPLDPAFSRQLLDAFRQETELMFLDLVREDRGVLSLLDSDYTWLNDRLARHYGIADVRGDYMRRVALPADSPRRGLLGHGSILTATSVANRTSPVVRGAWIVEGLLGAPVPTPPPGVETDLTNDKVPAGIVINTLRDRLELHRANPTCAACHQIMDPIGLALENFDLIGRWRTQENGFPLNTNTTLQDGTPIDGPAALRRALFDRGDAVASNIIEKLLSYALGRDLHSPDMAAVRKIAAAAEKDQYRFTDIVLGIVDSAPFRMNIVETPATAVADR